MDLIFTLCALAFISSAITGITGVGGGMVLVAILPSFLSSSLIIPVHGMTQLFSNISRAYFGYKDIYTKALPKYLLGSLLGVSISYSFLLYLSFTYIPLFIAVYILLSLWSKKFTSFMKRFESYFILGLLQSGLSLVVGATGAMSMPRLIRDCKDNNQILVTIATLSAITHFLKILVFIILGFSFFEHLNLVLFMIIGAVLGSYIGSKLRSYFDQEKLLFIMKIILTFLSIKTIIMVFN